MEAIVHKTFCNVSCIYAVLRFEVLAVNDALVGNAAGCTRIKCLELRLKLCCHIVCIEDGNLGNFLKACCAQQFDVSVGDRQQQRVTVCCSRNCTNTFAAALRIKWMARKIRSQCFCTADRAYARTTAAVRHCK